MLRLTSYAMAIAAAFGLPDLMTWEEWKAEFEGNRMLLEGADEEARRTQFLKNIERIKAQNALYEAGKSSYYYGVNQFTDLSVEEFRVATASKPRPERDERNVVLLDESATASSIDWREQNAVTPVKNQGQCGSCWSFSATGAMEGDLAVESGNLVALSEKMLMDCSTQNHSCEGGLMDYAFQFVISNGGIDSESDYPYNPEDGTCNLAKRSKHVATFSGFKDVTPNNAAQLAAAVSQRPVSVAIQANREEFQLYQGGVLDSARCGYQLDHGVLVVGMTDESNTEFPNAWIVKNSWGASWGVEGYIYISRETGTDERGICGILEDPSYPTGGQVGPAFLEQRLHEAQHN